MTERQKRFAEFYLETGNARQSAIRAGYSAGYAEHVKRQRGVKEYLEMRIDGMDRKRIASADEVLQFLTAVMRGDEKDEKGATLRMKAAEMISRRLGYEEAGYAGPAAVIVDDIGGTGDGEAVSQ
ncbi:MAG: terminase small subunit [Eubacteriales bacterium]|nr:terminase small subunit [Eubacteriales bacterium]MDO4389043.1 terminase small subunit [Eubacteriales bacterium]